MEKGQQWHLASCLPYFLATRDGTLLTGDAFDTMAGIAVSGTLKPLFPLVALATWHKPSCLESARKLRALSPSRLAVGHGPVLKQPLAAIDHAIGTLARELERKAKQQADSHKGVKGVPTMVKQANLLLALLLELGVLAALAYWGL